MNSTSSTQPQNTVEQPVAVMLNPTSTIQPPASKPLTFGQRLADKMASKVGSWAFLIGQTTILAGWVTANSIPGIPHWDEQPFILLNLMFSFASAYTAPIVLMSQNRQSEEDRESANHNYQVTLQAAQNLELLHQKLDAEYAQKLEELSNLIKQHASNDIKVVYVPTQSSFDTSRDQFFTQTLPVDQSKGSVFVNVPNGRSLSSQLNFDEAEVVVTK